MTVKRILGVWWLYVYMAYGFVLGMYIGDIEFSVRCIGGMVVWGTNTSDITPN